MFAGLVLAGLGAPLLWQDEADTAMFGRRILEYGYPKVHDPRNTVYGVHHPLELGVQPLLDAYLGSPWAQYYFAAPAVADSPARRSVGVSAAFRVPAAGRGGRPRVGRRAPGSRNVRINNLPELSPRNQSGLVHRFRSPVVGVDGAALVIGERQR